METLFFFIPILAFAIFICVVSVVVENAKKAKKDGKSIRPQSRGFNREVDAIHITSDAASERKRRLDQLKSLYEAGMMEKEEFYERCESVEADYLKGSRY